MPAELWNVAGEIENENTKATHARELDLDTSFCCNCRSFFHASDPPLFMDLPRHERPLQRTPPCKAILVGHAQSRKNFSARIFRENRKSCFSAGSGFFTYRLKFSALLNLRPNQIGAAKYQATPLPPNTKSYSYSIPHLSRSLHDFIGIHGDSGGHIKQTVCCGKKVIFICIVVSCLYY